MGDVEQGIQQAGTGIEVTPEMIEAGDDELRFYDEEYHSPQGRAKVLKRIFIAMLKASPQAGEPSDSTEPAATKTTST